MTKDSIQEKNYILSSLLFITIVWAAASAMMFFHSGSGEHDTFMMAAGIVHGVKTNQIFNPLNYAPNLQFTFYYLFHYISSIFPLDTYNYLTLMNIIGELLFLFIPIFILILLKTYFHSTSAYFVPILLVASPAYLFTLPYGHPFHIAFSLALLSLVCFFKSLTISHQLKRRLLFFLAATLQGLSLTIRMDQTGLFWFCILGLLIYSKEKDKRKWCEVFSFFVASIIIFSIFYLFLGPSNRDGSTFESGGIFVSGILKAILGTYRLDLLPWSMAHHITEIGLPIIVLSAYFILKNLKERQFNLILGLIISVAPSFLIYLFNPSPPRHFIITIIALSIFIALNISKLGIKGLISIGVLIVSINLLTPSLLNMVEPRRENSTRRNHTYNVIKRHDRNKEQIKVALPFFRDLMSRLPSNTVIFGNWIHIAQISMILSNEKELEFTKAKITPRTNAIEYSYRNKKIYLIESYHISEVREIVKEIKDLNGQYLFLSLLRYNDDINDFTIPIPEQINWWNA